MKLFLLALCCAIVYGATIPEDQPVAIEEVKLPEFAKSCNAEDANLNQCLKEAISEMLPRLNNGWKSLNIPPMDPFIIDRAQVQYGSGPIQGAIKVKNMKTFGMSQAIIHDVRMNIGDDETVKTQIDITFPKILMEGAYKADIKFNELKLRPKGHFNVTMTDIRVTHKWGGHLIKRNNHKYLEINEFDMIPEVGDAKIHIDGIFPDREMNELANNFLNQYWPSIYKMLLPETRTYWSGMMIKAINEFLGHVPFDLLVKTKN